jgi:Flp pilus assembly pilin Flp
VIKSFIKDESGTTAIEYGLIATAMAVLLPGTIYWLSQDFAIGTDWIATTLFNMFA